MSDFYQLTKLKQLPPSLKVHYNDDESMPCKRSMAFLQFRLPPLIMLLFSDGSVLC